MRIKNFGFLLKENKLLTVKANCKYKGRCVVNLFLTKSISISKKG